MRPSQSAVLASAIIGTLMTAIVAWILQSIFHMQPISNATSAWRYPGIWLLLSFCWLAFTGGFFQEMIKLELLKHFDRDWERTKKEGGQLRHCPPTKSREVTRY
jgi:hypothetical protein